MSLLKYNFQSKEYQFKRDQYDGIESLAHNESASKVLLIRDFPPIDCQDHQSMLSKMFFTTNKNQVYGSETYNALSAIEKDVGTS